jgi:hypothetical protein
MNDYYSQENSLWVIFQSQSTEVINLNKYEYLTF